MFAWRTSRHERLLSALAMVALLLFPASAALAAGPGYTQIDTGTYTYTEVPNCTAGTLYEVTIDYQDVTHVSPNAAGGMHFTYQETADFTATPQSNPAAPVYSGHYAGSDSGNFTAGGTANETFVFALAGKGTDGSALRFTWIAHLTVGANGKTVSFDRLFCH